MQLQLEIASAKSNCNCNCFVCTKHMHTVGWAACHLLRRLGEGAAWGCPRDLARPAGSSVLPAGGREPHALRLARGTQRGPTVCCENSALTPATSAAGRESRARRAETRGSSLDKCAAIRRRRRQQHGQITSTSTRRKDGEGAGGDHDDEEQTRRIIYMIII